MTVSFMWGIVSNMWEDGVQNIRFFTTLNKAINATLLEEIPSARLQGRMFNYEINKIHNDGGDLTGVEYICKETDDYISIEPVIVEG